MCICRAADDNGSYKAYVDIYTRSLTRSEKLIGRCDIPLENPAKYVKCDIYPPPKCAYHVSGTMSVKVYFYTYRCTCMYIYVWFLCICMQRFTLSACLVHTYVQKNA